MKSNKRNGLAELCLAFLCCAISVASAQDQSVDVVVFGATPGGIAASLAAGKSGRTVTLVAYQDHVGGMMASGLGKSDIEHRAMIGGLFKDFVQEVNLHYENTYGAQHENARSAATGIILNRRWLRTCFCGC